MAFALEPDGTVEDVRRPVVVELGHGHARGMTVVDWNRQSGQADRFRILMRYDQGRLDGLIRAALAAV
jgi:purine nucleosidase